MNSTTPDPIDLLFHGLEKLGPGDNEHTLRVLDLLPRKKFGLIVDAGCGTGRQTLALAKKLNAPIQAVELYQPFLIDLMRRARAAKVDHLITTHGMDMKDIPEKFPGIELLWSEGAAYNMGFENALAAWAPALAPGGLVVVSELTWLRQPAPPAVERFFQTGYPDMKTVAANKAVAEKAGYRVLFTHTLPAEAWTNGYYDVLGPRAQALLNHADAGVRAFAAETVREVEVFQISAGSYGYVFFALQI